MSLETWTEVNNDIYNRNESAQIDYKKKIKSEKMNLIRSSYLAIKISLLISVAILIKYSIRYYLGGTTKNILQELNELMAPSLLTHLYLAVIFMISYLILKNCFYRKDSSLKLFEPYFSLYFSAVISLYVALVFLYIVSLLHSEYKTAILASVFAFMATLSLEQILRVIVLVKVENYRTNGDVNYTGFVAVILGPLAIIGFVLI